MPGNSAAFGREAIGLAASGPGASDSRDIFNRLGERLIDVLRAPVEADPVEPADTEPLPPVPPAPPLPPPLPPLPPDPNQPITLHLDDVEIRRTLEMLSREGGLSILVSPGVSGRVTANIHQLSFDEAFRAILKLCDLIAYREGELIFVYNRQEVPQFNRQLATFPLDYASATDVYQAVQGLLSPAGQAFQTVCSPTDNRRTREVIVVEDLDVNVARIGEYIRAIDQPPRQVLIEVNVLKVELSDDMAHGVNFEQLIEWAGNSVNVQVKGFANPITPQSQGFFIDVDGASLDGLVEALQTTTDAKTMASPRVMVLNGQEARIQIGEQLGYRVITTTETASMEDVEFLEVGVVLLVTPHISRDNQVVMKVKPKVSTGQIDPKTSLPEEETTEVETNILLSDGRGMVIGGLIQEEDSDLQSKVPLLGDLWYVGRLFQRRTVKKVRSEIIITLKPRVLPYMPDYDCVDQVETERASTPLLYGPLCKFPRPWEAALPDAVHDPYPGAVLPDRFEYCGRPDGQCVCGHCP
jgi:type II secretory pathway component GspD/PulD (secretin)